ncbi:MAG TPA: dihydroorotate dehydrogenase [Rhodopila sp.]|nr:dihydroorotate dehydrogenase [Rhodopila sp.]
MTGGGKRDQERLAARVGAMELANPLICGSGEPVMTEAGIRAALRAGAAGVIAKSVNEQPAAARQLDRADYLRMDERGVPTAWHGEGHSLLCRSGLAQRDAGEWFAAIARLDREAAAGGRFVAASIVLGSAEGAEALAARARKEGVRLLELNVGAPHAVEARPGAIALETDPECLRELVARVRIAFGTAALWVKLTGLSTNLPALAVAAKEGGADAVVMMGRFMGMLPELDTFAPALGTSGAYGGPWALPIVCRFLALSRRGAGVDFPLVGTNGVRGGADIARMALAGAHAVEALSAVMLEGFAALPRMLAELDGLLAERGPQFGDLVGRTADALGAYGEQPAAPGRWERFVPPETLSQ